MGDAVDLSRARKRHQRACLVEEDAAPRRLVSLAQAIEGDPVAVIPLGVRARMRLHENLAELRVCEAAIDREQGPVEEIVEAVTSEKILRVVEAMQEEDRRDPAGCQV